MTSFARAAEQTHAWLERAAGVPGHKVALASTDDGRIIAQATLAPGERWLADLPFVREISLEVSRGWRRLGIATEFLRFLCAAPDIEDFILVGIGLSWFWDTAHERLSPAAYRAVILELFQRAGFQERRTSHPSVALRADSVLVARIGNRVAPAERQAFEQALVQRPALR